MCRASESDRTRGDASINGHILYTNIQTRVLQGEIEDLPELSRSIHSDFCQEEKVGRAKYQMEKSKTCDFHHWSWAL